MQFFGLRSVVVGVVCAMGVGMGAGTAWGQCNWWPGNVDDGSIHVPCEYATIQEAVDNALPGDLILVLPGDYIELVWVHVEGITIRAVAGATLTGSFVVSADSVSVEDWHVTTGFHNQGLQTTGVSKVSIENNTFVSSGAMSDYRGIWLDDCLDCSVKGNEFVGHQSDGIAIVDDCTGTEIMNNIARDNGLFGIRMWPGSTGARVANNEGFDNGLCDIVDDSGTGGHTFWNNKADCTWGIECTAVPPGLVHWWTGDVDASDRQGTNDGVLTDGAMAGASGFVGGAFDLDGANDRIITKDVNVSLANLTIAAWINPDNVSSGRQRIVTKFNGTGSTAGVWVFDFLANGALRFFVAHQTGDATNTLSAPGTVTSGTWQFVAATYDGTTVNLYHDDVLVASNVVSRGPLPAFSQPIVLGEDDPVNVLEFFDGLIDEVTLFDRDLDQTEIQAIYDAGSLGMCKDFQ
ncbi:MAG: LamG-like jellyroll fold domain-containing protein [Planctomycetota bacterium]|jgi:parallel beta-helix repeat protein